MSKILLIEQDRNWRDFLQKALSPPHTLDCAGNGDEAFSLLKKNEYEGVVLSLEKDTEQGLRLLRQARDSGPQTQVIVISGSEEASLVVWVVKEGAFDFLVKPFSKEKIKLTVDRSLENRYLKNEINYLRHEQDVVYDIDRIIAESPSMKRTMATLRKFAKTDSTILITGDTGSGKSFLSGSVHFNSRRKEKPFIKINCANIPETLLESELFGHERGAFTGANKTRVGRLEQAEGGTVFLDEIGEMSPALQAKLLRFLEEKSFERVGGNKTIHSDVRIIAATNRNLEEQVTEGKFREDLYYRVNVLRVHLPSLKERQACIEPLAKFLLAKACRNLRKQIVSFSSEALAEFKDYSWPGNIRQLANTVERAAILEESAKIQKENIVLAEPLRPVSESSNAEPAAQRSLKDQEKETILKALEECLWVQKDAARLLGISPRTLNYKIKKYQIAHPRWRRNR